MEHIDSSKGKWIKGFLAILTTLIIAVFWNSLSSSENATSTDQGSFITSRVDKGNIAQFITATGTVRPVSVVIVGTQLSGTVTKLNVDYNDKVRQGQILLELDPAIYVSQVNQAKANLQAAKAAMDLATSNRKRSEILFEKKFIQASTFESEKQLETSSAAQYQLALAQLEKAETDLRNTFIRSPIDGLVLKKDVDLGQTVAATFQTPELFRIAQDFAQMEIDTNVSEADISSIKTGMKASFTVDSFENRVFEGYVKQIRLSPNDSDGPVSYNVVLSVENPDRTLLPGMTASVQIVTLLKTDVLRIPTSSLYFSPTDDSKIVDNGIDDNISPPSHTGDGSLFVFDEDTQNYRVFKTGADDKLLPVAVKIGIKNRQFAEVVGGNLKEGDSIVTQERSSDTSK